MKVERALTPEEVREHRCHRLHLGIAIFARGNHLGVDTEGDIVHERLTIDRRQVDGPFVSRSERIQSSDDIIPVNAEVKGQVVSRAGGHTDVCQAMGGGHRCNQGLGTVASSHPENICASRHRSFGQCTKVVSTVEDDALDAPVARFGFEMGVLDLPASGFRIHQEDGVHGFGYGPPSPGCEGSNLVAKGHGAKQAGQAHS